MAGDGTLAGGGSGGSGGSGRSGGPGARRAYGGAPRRRLLTGKPAVAALSALVVVIGVAAALVLRPDPVPRQHTRAAETPAVVGTGSVAPSATPTPSRRPATPTPSARVGIGRSTQRAVPASRTAKKGVSTWEFAGVTAALRNVGAAWYYNWSPSNDSMPAPAGVQFVPMIWGAKSVDDATLAKARGEGRILLGFNEPDLAEQANMSVEQALDLWPKLEATGLRLGSPAVAWGADRPGGWLDRFMTGAKQRGLRVDFIALHWYGSDFSAAAVGHLRGYLEATYRRYHVPIWVTEYGLINFSGSPKYPSGAQQVAFIRGSTAMLESLSYVERYAWFSLPAEGAGTGLYRDGDTPTSAGAAYRAAGN